MARWVSWVVLVTAPTVLQFAVFPCSDLWGSSTTMAVAVGVPVAVRLDLLPLPRGRGRRAALIAVVAISAVAAVLMLFSHVCM